MRALVLTILLAVALTGEARAQGAGQGGVNPSQTAKVVTTLEDMFAACREITMPYRPDCLSRALQRAAGKISNNPGYWEAHVALTRASRSLTRLVRDNEDPDADWIRVEGYRLKAVREQVLPGLRAAGEEIMARAERDMENLSAYEREAFAPITALLRSQRPWP